MRQNVDRARTSHNQKKHPQTGHRRNEDRTNPEGRQRKGVTEVEQVENIERRQKGQRRNITVVWRNIVARKMEHI